MIKTVTELDYLHALKGEDFKKLEKIIKKGYMNELLYEDPDSFDAVSVYLNMYKRKLIGLGDEKIKEMIGYYAHELTKLVLSFIMLEPASGITQYDDYKTIKNKIDKFVKNGFNYKSNSTIFDHVINLETYEYYQNQYVAKYWYKENPELYDQYLLEIIKFFYFKNL